MALHVKVRRKGDLLFVFGQWEAGLPLFQNYTLRVEEGYTAAETVELDMLEMNLVASWSWTETRWYGKPELWGQFTRVGGHKEVKDSQAHKFDLSNDKRRHVCKMCDTETDEYHDVCESCAWDTSE